MTHLKVCICSATPRPTLRTSACVKTPSTQNRTTVASNLPAPLHPPHGQLLLVQSLLRSSRPHAVPAAAGQLRRQHLRCKRSMRFVVLLLARAALLAAGLTRAADRYVWCRCIVQRDVVFSMGEGWWVGGCMVAAGMVQRDSVRGQRRGRRGLGRKHAEQCCFL